MVKVSIVIFLAAVIVAASAVEAGLRKPECSMPMQKGDCKAMMPSYYYDPKSGKCERFFFSGCGGNANRYNTPEDCEAACIAH